ncbi:MAG: L-fucose/L-arabinose isomerase family protein [Phycisphaeraceae bacterium]|nr:L-fucose/L-arabinose isomerase family protein [Phycisphaeraceae bacterium]
MSKPKKVGSRTAVLIASGDLRESANSVCWPAQQQLEADTVAAFKALGWKIVRAGSTQPHGFISSQSLGREVFSTIHPDAPLVVAEAVWQYSHHVLAGLLAHRGPVLILANWSGQWPGLVGALNLRGSLTKAGRKYSLLWSEDFADKTFRKKLESWCRTGKIKHDLSHVQALKTNKLPGKERKLGEALAEQLKQRYAIMGVFDEGCMGMFNAIIPDHLLNPTGVFKERLSQSALYFAATQVSDDEARAVRKWYDDAGMKFNTGPNDATDLTDAQILMQAKTYIAAVRIADEFGCDAIGIQYQQGLKDLLPASDLVEGTLNCTQRPPVTRADGSIIREGEAITHFNEADECAGLDGLITHRVWTAMGMCPDNTLHDLRWGDPDASGTTDEYVWVFEISGSVPPTHFADSWKSATGERQPAMYFRLGGSTIKGVSKAGEIVWSRIYVADDALHMDLGRGKAIDLPPQETQRRWQSTTPQWPIMHGVTYGVSRDQMMAKHQANHIQVVYADNEKSADRALAAKAAMATAMGIQVNLCGSAKDGTPLSQRLAKL